MAAATDDGRSGRLTAAAEHSLSDAGHELATNVVVAPAVQDRIDASRASQRQHLEPKVEQAEELNGHYCPIVLGDQRQDVPWQPERHEVGNDQCQKATRSSPTTSSDRRRRTRPPISTTHGGDILHSVVAWRCRGRSGSAVHASTGHASGSQATEDAQIEGTDGEQRQAELDGEDEQRVGSTRRQRRPVLDAERLVYSDQVVVNSMQTRELYHLYYTTHKHTCTVY